MSGTHTEKIRPSKPIPPTGRFYTQQLVYGVVPNVKIKSMIEMTSKLIRYDSIFMNLKCRKSSNMNPIHEKNEGVQLGELESGGEKKDEDFRKLHFNQKDVPWEKVESRFDPTFMKCDGKIVKYDSKGLAIWRVRDDLFFFYPDRYLIIAVIMIGTAELLAHYYFRWRHVVSLEFTHHYLFCYDGSMYF